ncbi:MAG: LexA family transcriptional regulator [Tenericutes bacterium]|nr:LexA family transcriptional regulator [Mycoplasmatota bacterium]
MNTDLFPIKLKALRTSKNLSQNKLAKDTGITKQALSLYENGLREPGLYTIAKLADYFNVSLDFFITDDLNISNELLNVDISFLQSDINSLKKTISILENNIISCKQTIFNLEYTIDLISKGKIDNAKKTNKSNEEYADELAPNIIDLKSSKKEQIYREIKDFGPIPAGKISLTYEDNIEFVSIPKDNLNSSKGYYVLHISGDSMNKLYKDGEIILVENTSCVAPGDIVIARVGSDATIKRLEIDDEYISLIPESTNPKHKIQTFKHKDICIQGKVIGRLSDYI